MTTPRDAPWTSATRLIVMTSNLGSDLIRRENAMGFATKSDDAKTEEQAYQRMKDSVG